MFFVTYKKYFISAAAALIVLHDFSFLMSYGSDYTSVSDSEAKFDF